MSVVDYVELARQAMGTPLDTAAPGRCPACAELIRRGDDDALCSKCPAWPLQLYTPAEVEQFRRECMDPPEGEVYVRSGTLRQCRRCHELQSRGVLILHCSECDVLTDCPACKRLGIVCGMHFHPDGETPPGPVIGTEYVDGRNLRYERHGRTLPPEGTA